MGSFSRTKSVATEKIPEFGAVFDHLNLKRFEKLFGLFSNSEYIYLQFIYLFI